MTGALDRGTRRFRDRYATDVFLTGRPRRVDAWVSRWYFELAARTWERNPSVDGYAEPLHTALQAVEPPQRMLDIGTGAGVSARIAAATFPATPIEAVDASRALLRRARHAGVPERVRFRRAELRRLPYPDDAFDLVLAFNAIVEPVEVRRVLHPDGVVLMVSSFFPLRSLDSAWVRRWIELGFYRRAAGNVARGSWEAFVLG